MNNSRDHILKTAFILFLQKSFKAVTMKEIVGKSGLSKGAFYHYFPSKEKLFLEVVETYLRIVKVDFDSFSKNSFYEFYHDVLDYSIKKFMEMKGFLGDTNDEDDISYFTLMLDAINLLPGFKERAIELHARELAAWENAVQLAIDSGEIKSRMTAMQIAKIFVYTNDSIGQRLIMEGRLREVRDEIIAIWNGLYSDLKA